MESQDIRWIQRFSNFKKALEKLGEVADADSYLDSLSELEKEGLIQRFEYTFELAWNTLQDLFKEKGHEGITGPKPVISRAFQDGYITDGEGWKNMSKARNLSSHTYDSETADSIASGIVDSYYLLLLNLKNKLEEEASGKLTNLFEE